MGYLTERDDDELFNEHYKERNTDGCAASGIVLATMVAAVATILWMAWG